VLHKFLVIPLLCTLGSPASQIEAASIVSGRIQPFQKKLILVIRCAASRNSVSVCIEKW
jgi:hypothetical protein